MRPEAHSGERGRGQAKASEFIHQGSLGSFALTFGAEQVRSAKRNHAAAISTNTVLSWRAPSD
jgi:hypothetical protein